MVKKNCVHSCMVKKNCSLSLLAKRAAKQSVVKQDADRRSAIIALVGGVTCRWHCEDSIEMKYVSMPLDLARLIQSYEPGEHRGYGPIQVVVCGIVAMDNICANSTTSLNELNRVLCAYNFDLHTITEYIVMNNPKPVSKLLKELEEEELTLIIIIIVIIMDINIERLLL